MDRKRKWDQPGNEDESPQKVPKFEEGGKAATDAAAAAVGVACVLSTHVVDHRLLPQHRQQ